MPVERFGGLVTNWPAEMLDVSLAARAENVRFTASQVGSREGATVLARLGAPIFGLAEFAPQGENPAALAWDALGRLWMESPPGGGDFVRAAPSALVSPPAGSWLNSARAYNRVYMAFGDGRQGEGAPAAFDGINLDPITTAPPASAPEPQDSPSPGVIAAGQRYVIVLFQTRAGSLTAPGPPGAWSAAGGKEALIQNVPTGPPNVVARIVAFTVAGGSSAGPYFYIATPQNVNGVSETSTIIPDNSTTTITCNFDDSFLASSLDITNQFRAIALPSEAGVFFSSLTDRLVWWGEPGQPSLVRFSQPGDAGSYYGDTGFILVGDGDGQRVTAVFELRDQLFVAKEDSIYLVTPNAGDPATWDILQVAESVGVCGIRALDVANSVAVLVHRGGAYLFDGSQPQWISDELTGSSADQPGVWERINWSAGATIWAAMDEAHKEVRIGVPFDAAVAPSRILKLSYFDGWDRSFRFSAFTGRYHYFPGRRWSQDLIVASQAVLMNRAASASRIPADRRETVQQIILASSGEEGAVSFLDPDADSDDGVPIAGILELGAVSVAEQLRMQRQGVELVGLVQIRASASDRLTVEASPGGGTWRNVLSLRSGAVGDSCGLAALAGEAVRLRFSTVGGRWRLTAAYIFARPLWALRPGPIARPAMGMVPS